MRWTDVPPPAALTVLQWHDAMSVQDDSPVARAAWAAVAARAAAVGAGMPPVVAIAREAATAAVGSVRGRDVERGGLLLGQAARRDAGDAHFALVHVRAAVASDDDLATGFSLRMASGVWDAARRTLRDGEQVVGWYHSHPDLGAFFSGTDRRTQRGFFNHPWSLGWVIDPVRGEEAWFAGPESEDVPATSVVRLPTTA